MMFLRFLALLAICPLSAIADNADTLGIATATRVGMDNVFEDTHQQAVDCSIWLPDPFVSRDRNLHLFWLGDCENGFAEGSGVSTLSRDASGSEVVAKLHGTFQNGRPEGGIFIQSQSGREAIFAAKDGIQLTRRIQNLNIGTSNEKIVLTDEDAETEVIARNQYQNRKQHRRFKQLEGLISATNFYRLEDDAGAYVCRALEMLTRDEVLWKYGTPANTAARASDCYVRHQQYDSADSVLNWIATLDGGHNPLAVARLKFARVALATALGHENAAQTARKDGWAAYEAGLRQPVKCAFEGALTKLCSYTPSPAPPWVFDQLGYGKNTSIETYIFSELETTTPLQALFGLAMLGNTDAMLMLALFERRSIERSTPEEDNAGRLLPQVPETSWVKFWQRQAKWRGATASDLRFTKSRIYKDRAHLEDLILPNSFQTEQRRFLQESPSVSIALRHQIELIGASDAELAELAENGNFAAQDRVVYKVKLDLSRGDAVSRNIAWYYENTDFLEAHEIAMQCLAGLHEPGAAQCADFSTDMDAARDAAHSFAQIKRSRDNTLNPTDGWGLSTRHIELQKLKTVFAYLAKIGKSRAAYDLGNVINKEFSDLVEPTKVATLSRPTHISSIVLVALFDPLITGADPSFFQSAIQEQAAQLQKRTILSSMKTPGGAVDALFASYFTTIHHLNVLRSYKPVTENWRTIVPLTTLTDPAIDAMAAPVFADRISKSVIRRAELLRENLPFLYNGTDEDVAEQLNLDPVDAMTLAHDTANALHPIYRPETSNGTPMRNSVPEAVNEQGELSESFKGGLIALAKEGARAAKEVIKVFTKNATSQFQHHRRQMEGSQSRLEYLFEAAYMNDSFEYSCVLDTKRSAWQKRNLDYYSGTSDLSYEQILSAEWDDAKQTAELKEKYNFGDFYSFHSAQARKFLRQAFDLGSIDAQVLDGQIYLDFETIGRKWRNQPPSAYLLLAAKGFVQKTVQHPLRHEIAQYYSFDWPSPACEDLYEPQPE
ncbi:hypothetical protein [Thalassobius sp. Cn5-15]|uniref:hypothetical protein n=1 Tax=Thalassobius sp. Cn5-15 TaxID=2917763 RepID=UPI001EF25E57|nr:hypothetical protein [Thalassobius sp. Cn5-15]MCG7494106.1 hypothetical protein [Thalassobius sp. Cn5-15]